MGKPGVWEGRESTVEVPRESEKGKRYSSRKGGRRMAACAAERARNREQVVGV